MELILHEKPKRPTIIEGFPGVGYVGTITVEYMINHLDAKPIGLIFDENIPPVAMLYKDQTRRLMEIYYKKMRGPYTKKSRDFVLTTSRMTICEN